MIDGEMTLCGWVIIVDFIEFVLIHVKTHGGFLVSEEEWPGPSKFGKRKWEDNRPVGWSYGYNRMENSTWYKEPGDV
jgi:hypothetical protein